MYQALLSLPTHESLETRLEHDELVKDVFVCYPWYFWSTPVDKYDIIFMHLSFRSQLSIHSLMNTIKDVVEMLD